MWPVPDRKRVVVFVWDASPQPPSRADPDADAESGRGLLLVATLSKRWGWYPERQWGGKAVWSELEAAPVASGDLAPASCP